MQLLRHERLPAGDEWMYEIKLDGYRALATRTVGISSAFLVVVMQLPGGMLRGHFVSFYVFCFPLFELKQFCFGNVFSLPSDPYSGK